MRNPAWFHSIGCMGSVVMAMFALATVANAGATRLATYAPGSPAGFANEPCDSPGISRDGRFVTFSTRATNLGLSTHLFAQVFVRDLATGRLELVSQTSSGAGGFGHSFGGSLSADGWFVAFASSADEIALGGNPGDYNIVVRDRATGTNELVSVGMGGAPPNGKSLGPAISGDGRYVVFASTASNLVANDTTDIQDLFRYDRFTHTTIRVNVTASGEQPIAPANWEPGYGPSCSHDGRYVAFSSRQLLAPIKTSTGPNDVFVKDLVTGAVICASVTQDGASTAAGESLSRDLTPDGRFVVFMSAASNIHPADSNNYYDIYVRDLALGVTDLASVRSDGTVGSQNCDHGHISADGRFVVFSSGTTDLAIPVESELDYDVFLHDRTLGTTERVALTADGALPSAATYFPSISGDGMNVVFASSAIDLDTSVLPHSAHPQQQTFVNYRTGFRSLLGGIPGTLGIPSLTATGELEPRAIGALEFAHASANSATLAILSLDVGKPGPLPFFAGELYANPPLVFLPFVTSSLGTAVLPFSIAHLPSEIDLISMQFAVLDSSAVFGVALSNLLVTALP